MRAGGLPPATPMPVGPSCWAAGAFNEGRGVTPGDAWGSENYRTVDLDRSMRAGGLPPATHFGGLLIHLAMSGVQ